MKVSDKVSLRSFYFFFIIIHILFGKNHLYKLFLIKQSFHPAYWIWDNYDQQGERIQRALSWNNREKVDYFVTASFCNNICTFFILGTSWESLSGLCHEDIAILGESKTWYCTVKTNTEGGTLQEPSNRNNRKAKQLKMNKTRPDMFVIVLIPFYCLITIRRGGGGVKVI